MKIKITEKQIGQRIDKSLAEKLSSLSRSQIQKLIKTEAITVNNKKINVHYNLKKGDIINIAKTKPIEPEKILEKIEKKNLPKLEIIADTDEYLVINKPAGLTMHGADYIKEITLVDLILKKYPKIKKIGEDPARPGIMHRIDKEVSGLVVIAKTADSFDNLKKQFQERTIKKEYTALVYGRIEKDEGEINFPIQRASTGHKMAALPETTRGKRNKEGKTAITNFKIIQRFINFTLVEVKIKTGRTHQIRVHMAAYDHPIVGDTLYNTHKTRGQNKKLALGRVWLFANKLTFKDLKGIEQEFKIEMPGELKKIFRKNKMKKRKNNLFIISGPSGAGEDSIIEGLKKIIPLERVITTTTRKMRVGESQKNPYYFISKEEFKEGIKKNKFFEYAKEYNNNYYGVTNKEIERVKKSKKIGVWKIEYKGVISVKKVMPEIKAIFINAPLKILENRIKRRDSVSNEYVKERMKYTKEWLKHKYIYDYEIMNEEGKLAKAIQKIHKIIKKEANLS